MDKYATASYTASKLITNAYSTSFSMSIRLFAPALRPHIYAIYGLVRIADEIVDTYNGPDQRTLLDNLEVETAAALRTGYSTNPIVHAFALTARQFAIDEKLLSPFFESMRMDLSPQTYTQARYDAYIYGSAEVVGLMCLKVFTNDKKLYETLAPSASKLGAAYQKVNFLRDIAADSEDLGRWYFPKSSAATFNDDTKAHIVDDIDKDFAAAKTGIAKLPPSSRRAVMLSYEYYLQLLTKIKHTPAETLLKNRVRLSNFKKTRLLVKTSLRRGRHAN